MAGRRPPLPAGPRARATDRTEAGRAACRARALLSIISSGRGQPARLRPGRPGSTLHDPRGEGLLRSRPHGDHACLEGLRWALFRQTAEAGQPLGGACKKPAPGSAMDTARVPHCQLAWGWGLAAAWEVGGQPLRASADPGWRGWTRRRRWAGRQAAGPPGSP